jgi:conjugative transfer signal peptidase TraF
MKTIIAMLAGLSMLGFSWTAHPLPRLLWNASASVPIGLYVVRPVGALSTGELLIVRPPPSLARYMAVRDYLALGVPLIKHIAALPGQRVCRFGSIVLVDGHVSAEALTADERGKELPMWHGCIVIPPHEIFLLNASVPDSFDGRYFGALPDTSIIGSATPLWIPRVR